MAANTDAGVRPARARRRPHIPAWVGVTPFLGYVAVFLLWGTTIKNFEGTGIRVIGRSAPDGEWRKTNWWMQPETRTLTVRELEKLGYVTLTGHQWAGFNLIANLKMWQGLPSNVQRIIERNAEKYVKLQRNDTDKMNHDLPARLTQRGMIINQSDAASFRARLGGYYARWKDTLGSKTWALLESHVGKLGPSVKA